MKTSTKKLVSIMLCMALVLTGIPVSAISTVTDIVAGTENGENSEMETPEGEIPDIETPEEDNTEVDNAEGETPNDENPEEELPGDKLPEEILPILPEEGNVEILPGFDVGDDYYYPIIPGFPEINILEPNRLRSGAPPNQIVTNPSKETQTDGTIMRKSITQTGVNEFDITLEAIVKNKPIPAEPIDVVMVIDTSTSMGRSIDGKSKLILPKKELYSLQKLLWLPIARIELLLLYMILMFTTI